MIRLDEQVVKSKLEREAERLFRKYKPYMEILESKTLLPKFRKIGTMDYWALGKMLESVDNMIRLCEADGSVADLGLLPRIARDVVTISYGTSPISVIASVQPQDEEIGIVYYKAVRVTSGSPSTPAGTTIASALGDWYTPVAFANTENSEVIGTGDGVTKSFSAILLYKPVRPGTVVVQAGDVTGRDVDQNGKIIGEGIKSGSIDYTTGQISIEFDEAPVTGVSVVCIYWASAESVSLGLRELNYELVSTVVRAKIYALKGVTGLFKSYAMQKRFGIAAEEELAIDLINAINSEICGDLIKKINASVPGNANVVWSVSTPAGVSYFEHKQSLKDAFAGAERKIIENAKRGNISFIIAGTGVASVLRTLFGWETIYEGHGIATAHLFGRIDGIPVIRVTDTSVLDPNVAICGYKGPSAFEAPAVFAPYMPLTVTNVLPTPHPLVTQRAAAVWAAVEVLVKNFLSKLTITGTYPY
ncbi:MAG: hypothetical protein QXE04_00220 [Thermoplasmatales archaeon]